MAKKGEIDRFTKGSNDIKNVKVSDSQKRFIEELNKSKKKKVKR